jgi:hypothetical protein
MTVPWLPFVLTWTNTDVYVSLSMELLRVFKISVRVREEKTGRSEACRAVAVKEVCTLAKDVVLPRSVRLRPVYFPPTRGRRVAKIVLGALYGEQPEPLIVV